METDHCQSGRLDRRRLATWRIGVDPVHCLCESVNLVCLTPTREAHQFVHEIRREQSFKVDFDATIENFRDMSTKARHLRPTWCDRFDAYPLLVGKLPDKCVSHCRLLDDDRRPAIATCKAFRRTSQFAEITAVAIFIHENTLMFVIRPNLHHAETTPFAFFPISTATGCVTLITCHRHPMSSGEQ